MLAARAASRSARRSARRSTAEGVELHFGAARRRRRRDGDDYVLEFPDGTELRGDKLLVATGRRPRVEDIGLETVGIEPGKRGIEVDDAHVRRRRRVGDRRRDRHLAAHLRGQVSGPGGGRQHPRPRRRGDYEAVPRVVFTDPQAAVVGEPEGRGDRDGAARRRAAHVDLLPRLRRTPGSSPCSPTASVLTGATPSAPRPASGCRQATLAIRARVPLDVLKDTIQPFPTFSEVYLHAMQELGAKVAASA